MASRKKRSQTVDTESREEKKIKRALHSLFSTAILKNMEWIEAFACVLRSWNND